MTERVRTFADSLRQFALSVDIVTQATFNRVRDYVLEYMQDELDAAYFGLMTRSMIDGQPGLQTTWSSADQGFTTMIRAEGGYPRQVSLAFDQRRPLWIVSRPGVPLREVLDPSGFIDLWSGTPDLPNYEPPIDQPTETCIILPVVRVGRALGVIHLESAAYIEATPVAQRELGMLADAIAMLMELRDANRTQMQGTEQAVGELGRFRATARFPRLTKPNLYLGSAENSDMRVLSIIREVLQEFSDKVAVFDWQELTDTEIITAEIAERVVRSHYGIFYFSEPAVPGATHKYTDNPNVIFEAGMLHGLVNAPDTPPSGWIPVREDDSPKALFDFAVQRIELVPRDKRGKIDDVRFKELMRRRMASLLTQR
jgi:hypothetical protein